MRRNRLYPDSIAFLATVLCTLIFLDSAVLARYTHDSSSRRIAFEDPVASRTTLYYYYYYETVIEERDGNDTRLRYRANGSHFVDERISLGETV